MLEHLPEFLLTTTVQCIPALIALIAWSEGGTKILRQYGAPMLWELSALVAVGVGLLLYATLNLLVDEGANVAVIVVASLGSVAAVTALTHRVRVDSSPLRLTLAASVSYVALEAGVMLGLVVSMLLWTPAN